MIKLRVENNLKLPLEKSVLTNAARQTLEYTHSPGNSSLTIVLGNDNLLHKLNLKYRHVDAPTDVLSFPSGELDPDTSDMYLGDVIVSLPRAQEQAASHGHLTEDELQLLVVHGTLHLLGYDHGETDDRKRMQAAQDGIMKQLGVALNITL